MRLLLSLFVILGWSLGWVTAASAIPPKPSLSGEAPWTVALPMDRNSEFVTSTLGGAKVIVDQRLGWMWAPPAPRSLEWYDAYAYCDGLTYAGFSDWHLPGFWQLRSIVDHNRSGNFVFPIFSQVKPEHILWSRDDSISIDQPDFDDRWAFFTKIGLFTFEERDQEFNAMCVRGKDPEVDAPEGPARFVEVSPDLIQDRRSGLYWTSLRNTRFSNHYMFTVVATKSEAELACEKISLAGKSNWRLPNVQELSSIIQPYIRYPSTSMIKFPDSMLSIWTSDTVKETGFNWMVHGNGQFYAVDTKEGIFGCVHD